jgi:DNA processing protein
VARNRLIAALADGVLVTEAAANSGSLHTANYALDLGKPVMAVPGNINSSLSEGSNSLIKSGALPVTGVQDICMALDLSTTAAVTDLMGSSHEENKILQLINSGVTDSKQLLELSGLDPPIFNQNLTMLEITGHIYALGGGHWASR